MGTIAIGSKFKVNKLYLGTGSLGNSDCSTTPFMGGMYLKVSGKLTFPFSTKLEGLGTA